MLGKAGKQRALDSAKSASEFDHTTDSSWPEEFLATDGWSGYDVSSLTTGEQGDRKWWHVPDEKIEQLVEVASKKAGMRSSFGKAMEAKEDTQMDSLDKKLGATEETREENRDLDDDDELSEKEKPWKVSDFQILQLVEDLQGTRSLLSASREQPPMRSQASPRRTLRHPIHFHAEDKISVHILLADSGDRMTLRVVPDLRIEPPQKQEDLPAASPRLSPMSTARMAGSGSVDRVGLALRNLSVGFRLAGQEDRKTKAPSPRIRSDSLKGMIEDLAGVPIASQKLYFQRCALRPYHTTLEACGIHDGETVTLYIQSKKSLSGALSDRSHVAGGRSRLGFLKETGNLNRSTASGDFWMMPKWNQAGSTKGLLKAAQTYTNFRDYPPYMTDAHDANFARVRKACNLSIP
eukprot:TRINITY_DN31947_c0_g1_i1.p1 TRINITY_DN31947_c0_g1~~TRINITY_DN31947_c0_g1_i1.p1  ORF type:complete len:407 (-),score=71.24 TRINITY_DN31947_c0_g1_i1:126-1346(-)